MKNWKLLIFIIVFFVSLNVCKQTSPTHVPGDFSFYTPSQEKRPFPLVAPRPVKNVILMIGDGMGFTHIVASRTVVLGAQGRLTIERLPVIGVIDNYAANEFVSGSAATATSLATGFKTNGNMLSILPDGTPALTILEAAREMGMSTGLVATSTITHATPAAFAAHTRNRHQEAEIAVQLLESKVNVLMGGGRALFKPGISGYKFRRTDDRDLIEEARNEGYAYIETREELLGLKAENEYVLGLFSNGYMITEYPAPSLAEMTEKAIEILSQNEEGFFLMVEGSQIDWGSEDNDINYTIREQLHFDLAIRRAIRFALDNASTLVVVTSDHEAGGMFISEDPPNQLDGKINIQWGTDEHNGTAVPVFAYGPHAERFMGWYDNTEVPKKIADILGLQDFPRKMLKE
ncbi:alkaline phosphatase [Acidobacteriota bacterium]